MVIMGGDLFFTVLGLSMVDVLVGDGIFWTMFERLKKERF